MSNSLHIEFSCSVHCENSNTIKLSSISRFKLKELIVSEKPDKLKHVSFNSKGGSI